MNETRTEYYLRNINEKLANFNKFIWFGLLSTVVTVPIFSAGLIFQYIAMSSHDTDLMTLSLFCYATGGIILIVLFIIALISLCKSTKDSDE